jgi:Domain of unknown function (DUF4252)
MQDSMLRSWIRLLPIVVALAAPGSAWADAGRIQFPNLDGLAAKATNTVDISLDPSLLKLASQFMGKGANDAAVQAAVSGLKGIYVRSFQFPTDNAYPRRDVDQVLSQLAGPGWNKLVSVHDSLRRQDVDVYLFQQGKRVEGLVIVAAQPRELTLVNIVGSLSLAQLSGLEGKFGVPVLPLSQKPRSPTSSP